MRLDGLVTANVAAGEGIEAYVGHDAEVVVGPVAHPVDVERPRGVLVRRRGNACRWSLSTERIHHRRDRLCRPVLPDHSRLERADHSGGRVALLGGGRHVDPSMLVAETPNTSGRA